METKSGDRQLTKEGPFSTKELNQEFFSAAQLQKQQVDASLKVAEILKKMNLRNRSVELAAQFKSDDPMKLAREIYKFLSDTEV